MHCPFNKTGVLPSLQVIQTAYLPMSETPITGSLDDEAGCSFLKRKLVDEVSSGGDGFAQIMSGCRAEESLVPLPIVWRT